MVKTTRRANASLQKRWETMSPVARLCLLCLVAIILHKIMGNWSTMVTQSVGMERVIGNQSSIDSRLTAVTDETYYLSTDFNNQADRHDWLDEQLFVTSRPQIKPVKHANTEKAPKPKVSTPLAHYVTETLKLSGIEQDGAFINNNYFLWGEELTVYPIHTEQGTFTAKLLRVPKEGGVLVKLSGQIFRLDIVQ